MNQQFAKQSIKLSLEFDRYLAKHPELYDNIPNGAYIVITLENDPKFTQQSIAVVREPRRKNIVEARKSGSNWQIQPFKFSAA